MIDIKRILLPTDFSNCANHAVNYACSLAEKFEAELHLLHVIQDPTTDLPDFGMGLAFPAYLENIPEKRQELSAAATDKLTEQLTPGWAESHQVTYSVAFGAPFVKILEYADQQNVDLIVIGTHGRTGVMHVLLGSVAERVIQRAVCPVLTVRPQIKQEV